MFVPRHVAVALQPSFQWSLGHWHYGGALTLLHAAVLGMTGYSQTTYKWSSCPDPLVKQLLRNKAVLSNSYTNPTQLNENIDKT